MDPRRFADANAALDAADVAMLGVPYDGTASFKRGARDGPAAIRQASWSFESFHLRNGADVSLASVHDAGDVDVEGLTPPKLRERVRGRVQDLVAADALPIVIGGEHSVTVGAVEAVAAKHPDLVVLGLDAHLDYRSEYENEPMSHACVARRLAEVLGPKRVSWLGVRSAGADEWHDARRDGLGIVTGFEVRQRHIGPTLTRALRQLPAGPLYVTIDVDSLDPAYAPGTGTPEPFGLTPWDLLHVITRVAPRAVALDVTEVAPFDAGQTAVVAARMIREFLAERLVRQG